MANQKSIFAYSDYKQYVNDWISFMPKAGHGEFRKISGYLRVNSVVVSQIFRGERDLSAEQALELAKYLALTELEREYFILLVQRARAGTASLKEYYSDQLKALRVRSNQLKNRIPTDRALSSEEKSIFYSSWIYSAIRLACSFPNVKSPEQIAKLLDLPREHVANVVEFLLSTGLLVKKNEKLEIGPSVTHIENTSPFVVRHHHNWRVRALQSVDKNQESDLHYTGPMALSQKAVEEIREKLIQTIKESTKIATSSDSEKMYCLCLDWFDYATKS